MQVYKVDFAGKTLTEYGAGLNVSFDKYGSVVESATFSTSNTGLKVATIEDSDHNVYFKYLNSSLQWEDITISENLWPSHLTGTSALSSTLTEPATSPTLPPTESKSIR